MTVVKFVLAGRYSNMKSEKYNYSVYVLLPTEPKCLDIGRTEHVIRALLKTSLNAYPKMIVNF
jgi:hypothetical protein